MLPYDNVMSQTWWKTLPQAMPSAQIHVASNKWRLARGFGSKCANISTNRSPLLNPWRKLK